MKITITINCDNAAFDQDPAAEVRRILDEEINLPYLFSQGGAFSKSLKDENGNTCGTVKRTGKRNGHPEVRSI